MTLQWVAASRDHLPALSMAVAADLAADLDNDADIGINDFLLQLGNWG